MAVAWTTLGVLTAALFSVIGLLANFGGRFDSVNARIDALAIDLKTELRSLREEIRELSSRLSVHIERHPF
jgi:hypothetical protein